ncbi:uncharacterized protein YndB with AHSA1/START domain [Pseudoduganella flava]|uniref:Uncharacterized protein YndB with AHSA1/START domain n=1 Tax=Pseudoduganella flava TaxID=871742 RepID=A0A562PLD3_9BURK|nr:SRPBCC domain-containing protein [Pseudoduganella flava]QGZ41025.1 hypothetical protein GO485_19420 [Pseudoduganella flava]TWI45281.1 uncharacterized protein YndB with AHSA1/START domain [Pseudoduganella flava]
MKKPIPIPGSRRLRAPGFAALLGALSCAGPCAVVYAGPAQDGIQMARDLAARSPDVHWPAEFTPDVADLFAHNDIDVAASCEDVFAQLADAARWPSWYANAEDVRVQGGRAGKLGPGSRFDWRTFGLPVRSRVHEYVEDERIGWFGDAPDLRAYHTWLLTPRDGGCLVQSEEVVRGPGALRLRDADPAGMHKGHDVWNAALKAAVERRP